VGDWFECDAAATKFCCGCRILVTWARDNGCRYSEKKRSPLSSQRVVKLEKCAVNPNFVHRALRAANAEWSQKRGTSRNSTGILSCSSTDSWLTYRLWRTLWLKRAVPWSESSSPMERKQVTKVLRHSIISKHSQHIMIHFQHRLSSETPVLWQIVVWSRRNCSFNVH